MNTLSNAFRAIFSNLTNTALCLGIIAVIVGQFALIMHQEAIPTWSWSLTTNLDEITVEEDDASADTEVTVADLVAVDMSSVGFLRH